MRSSIEPDLRAAVSLVQPGNATLLVQRSGAPDGTVLVGPRKAFPFDGRADLVFRTGGRFGIMIKEGGVPRLGS